MNKDKKNVCIVVLGDIGRSPRMQYHALSLAENGHTVDILAYGETQPMNELKAAPSIYYHYLLPVPYIPLRVINYPFKALFQALNLLFLLFTIRRPDVVLVQNPPAVPSLAICWLFCKIFTIRFIIDWHNYAYTIMALNTSKKNVFVRLVEKCEAFFGTKADYSFCVTEEMKKDLSKQWNIKATTLYDKPPNIFRPITLKDKHDFLLKLGKMYPVLVSSETETIFTKRNDTEVKLKENRPGLLVSSTSWTEDEDFSVLFSALQEYENQHTDGNPRQLPELICIITGKGNLKKYYSQKIKKQNWKHVQVIMPWLEHTDYPLLLASADLGVSLHTSSSGLDLPMKVVDMFGCCLPVLAYDFNCLHELVIDGVNSYTFNSAADLTQKLLSWFEQFPQNETQLNVERKFKQELDKFQRLRWRENWNNVALQAFK